MFVDSITLLVKEGYTEHEVMNMPLDKFSLCTKSVMGRSVNDRATMVIDTAAAIGGVFGEKGSLNKYLDNFKVK